MSDSPIDLPFSEGNVWFMDEWGQPLLIIDVDGKLSFGAGLGPKDLIKILTDAFYNERRHTDGRLFEFWWCPEHDKVMRPGAGRHSKSCKVENYTPLYSIRESNE